MLRAKFPGEKRMVPRKGLSLALVRDLNERVLILLEKPSRSRTWKQRGNKKQTKGQ